MIYFDNDLWSEFKQNGGVYLQGSGVLLEDVEMKNGNLTDMECLVNYLAPAYFKENHDSVSFFVEPGISQYYCDLIEVCPEECKNIALEGEFMFEPEGTVRLLEMKYSEHKYEEEGNRDPDNGFLFGIGDVQGKLALNDVIVFPAAEENNGIADVILFVPPKLVPQSIKQEYNTKGAAVA